MVKMNVDFKPTCKACWTDAGERIKVIYTPTFPTIHSLAIINVERTVFSFKFKEINYSPDNEQIKLNTMSIINYIPQKKQKKHTLISFLT